MAIMNRPEEVFLQGLQCVEYALYIGRVKTSLPVFWDVLKSKIGHQ